MGGTPGAAARGAHAINELAELVQRARRAVAFTGAGISTECGVPDFRSPGGFWTRYKPIEFQDFLASEETRLEAWRRYFVIHESFKDAEPGASHRALARLMELGHVAHVLTQNIDDLHARAGIARERIVELHGNGAYAHCLSCGLRHELAWVRDEIERRSRPPACTACGGLVKSATISFGQPMPEAEMARAKAATLDADLFLALGSSLQVYPAAGLPILAKHNRTPLVIVNREPTPLDGLADLVVHADIGPTLESLMRRLARGSP
jgi:NAD-dependent deacetylase